jgi:molecular chaperone GrpE
MQQRPSEQSAPAQEQESPSNGAPEGGRQGAPEGLVGAERREEPSAHAPAGATPAEDGRERGQEGEGAPEAALGDDVAELVAVAAQRDEYLALAQRTQADFENYKKRVLRESSAALARGIVKLAKELLPALDNLDRALAEAGEDDGPFVSGVRLVRNELQAALERVGIESFSPLGERFDPTSQEAIAQRPAEEEGQSGHVVEVYQSGYRMADQIIRPARVVVAA